MSPIIRSNRLKELFGAEMMGMKFDMENHYQLLFAIYMLIRWLLLRMSVGTRRSYSSSQEFAVKSLWVGDHPRTIQRVQAV